MCQRHNFVNKPIHKIEIDMDMWEEYENQGDMAIMLKLNMLKLKDFFSLLH